MTVPCEETLAMVEVIAFVSEHAGDLGVRTLEHLQLTFLSLLLGIAIGVPLGVVATRFRRLGVGVLAGVGILQTVPSLALLSILLVLCGTIGTLPAVIALTLYALLPIVRNTATGLAAVPFDTVEAADALGMTGRQKLWSVELPLALPSIVAGVRTAAVIGVGVATLAAFIGAGGLGQFINRGLALSDVSLILLGAVPAALLALIVDGLVAAFAWGVQPTRQRERSRIRPFAKRIAVLAPPLLVVGVLVGPLLSLAGRSDRDSTIVIGSKKFAEQYVLGEMLALLIEDRLGLNVERRFTLGGTLVCHEALLNGGIDLYPEYTGTALVTVLKEPLATDPTDVFETVSSRYRDLGLTWMRPFGFDNTYVLTVRQSAAAENGWTSISDLRPDAPRLTAGFESEFVARDDGYRGLRDQHDLEFSRVVDMEQSLMYQAAAAGDVDIICAYATDGRIDRFDLQPLDDDLGVFPPYEAATVVRSETLQRHPDLAGVVSLLGGQLDDATMRRLNGEVDIQGRAARDVARQFLIEVGLLADAATEPQAASTAPR